MPTIEELEHRVARLETLLEEVIKERLNSIFQRLDQLSQRLDQLYEKTERDKTEIFSRMAQDKTEILSKVADVLVKTERDKREIIYWVAGLMVGFATLLITAMWALLSFAIKP